jgi:hypothetical protein
MGKTNPGHRAMKKKKREEKQAQRKLDLETRIKEGNLRHDLQYGSNPVIIEYYKDYIQGTGLRQSK